MMNKKLVNCGLQSNKYSIHFSTFIAESWLCSMLRSILLPPKLIMIFMALCNGAPESKYCTFRIYTLPCAPLRFGLLRLIFSGARLGTIQHAHKKRLFPFEHSLLCVAQCVRSCVKVAWQRNSALT